MQVPTLRSIYNDIKKVVTRLVRQRKFHPANPIEYNIGKPGQSLNNTCINKHERQKLKFSMNI